MPALYGGLVPAVDAAVDVTQTQTATEIGVGVEYATPHGSIWMQGLAARGVQFAVASFVTTEEVPPPRVASRPQALPVTRPLIINLGANRAPETKIG